MLHFGLIGAVGFLMAPGTRAAPGGTEVDLRDIQIPAARIERLLEEFTRTTGQRPGPDDRRALIAREIDSELLYREALARGLDRGDPSIRWQLVEKMSFLEGMDDRMGDPGDLFARARRLGLERDDPVIRRMLIEKLRLLVKAAAARETVPDDVLRARLVRQGERYRTPARVTLHQVFFSRALRGAGADDAARRLLASLNGPTPPEEASADAFPLPTLLRAKSAAQLASAFGDGLAAVAMTAPLGRWIGPIPSPYGLHLIRVEHVDASTDPPFAAVRDRVLADLREERGREVLEAFTARLRAHHVVRVDGTDTPRS